MRTEVAQIVDVDEVDRVPTGTYRVKTMSNATIEHVPQLLPMASFRLQKGAGRTNRLPGGSGMLPVATRGAWCLIVTIGESGLGRDQAFILGFFAPRRDERGGHMNLRKRVRPGGFDLRTPFGSGLTLHADGGIEIEADSACERLMTPLAEGVSDQRQALIADLCRNYALNTAAGQVRFGELGRGKAGYHAKIFELSRWSPAAVRKAKNRASAGIDPASASSDDLDASNKDRFVEIEYGAVKGGKLYRERFVGSKSVEISCDGKGGWDFTADIRSTEKVGALVTVEATEDGTRTVTAQESTYTIAGRVIWEVPEFVIRAADVAAAGVVRFNQGARPGARVMDLVQVGDDIGHIITGDPLFLH